MQRSAIRFIFSFLVLLIFSAQARAQKINVSFKATGNKNEAVPFASFTVIKRSDSLQTLQKVSDSSGVVKFSLDNSTQYIVRITSVNYQPLEKGITVNQSHNFFSFSLESSSKPIHDVTL